MVAPLKGIHPSLYTSIQNVLKPRTQYTIVAAAYGEYRGVRRWHYITECGLRVRAGESLRKIWNEWRNHHLDKDCHWEM